MAPPTRSHGSNLSKYPRPSVAVDVAVLTVRDETLKVVVVEHRLGGLALPGTFLHVGERLADAASRALREKAGLADVDFAQLQVFDDPARDDRGWVLSVGHSAAVAADRIPDGGQLLSVADGQPKGSLLFDHAAIVQLAVEQLRRQYASELDPAQLLGETFTVLEVRKLYQAIFGHPLAKDTFRRYVIHCIEPIGQTAVAFGRPAELFRRTADAVLPASAWGFLTSGRASRR